MHAQVRSTLIESLQKPDCVPVNTPCYPPGTFKLIESVPVPGFPFTSTTTDLLPAFGPFAALSHVDARLAAAVGRALMALNQTNDVNQYLAASSTGGFVPPQPYTLYLRDIQRKLGLLSGPDEACARSDQARRRGPAPLHLQGRAACVSHCVGVVTPRRQHRDRRSTDPPRLLIPPRPLAIVSRRRTTSSRASQGHSSARGRRSVRPAERTLCARQSWASSASAIRCGLSQDGGTCSVRLQHHGFVSRLRCEQCI